MAGRVQRSATLRSRHSRHSRQSGVARASGQSDRGLGGRVIQPDTHLAEDNDVYDVDQPEAADTESDPEEETRRIVEKTEEPGLDSLRGTFGAIGTIIRAKRRAIALSAASAARNSRSSLSQHSQGAARSPRTSTSTRPGWGTGHWTTPKGSRFLPVKEDQDVEKGEVVEVEVHDEKGDAVPMKAQSSASILSTSPSTRDYPASPTSIPLHTLRSQSTLRSEKDTVLSGETSRSLVHGEEDTKQTLGIDNIDEQTHESR